MKALVVIVALLAGCKEKRNCMALGEHVADVATRQDEPRFKQARRDNIAGGIATGCTNRSYTDSEMDCLEHMTTAAEQWTCLGMRDLDAPEEAPPKPKATYADGSAALVAALKSMEPRLGVAFMHGCREGLDRLDDLWAEAAKSADELHRIVDGDDEIHRRLDEAIHDKSDPAIEAELGVIASMTPTCETLARFDEMWGR